MGGHTYSLQDAKGMLHPSTLRFPSETSRYNLQAHCYELKHGAWSSRCLIVRGWTGHSDVSQLSTFVCDPDEHRPRCSDQQHTAFPYTPGTSPMIITASRPS
jgi:hypothetical protein